MSQAYYYEPYAAGPPRITWGVQRLVLLSVSVFAAQLVLGIPFGDVREAFGMAPGGAAVEWLGFSVTNLTYGLVFTPLTYMFLHGSLSHLFFNMVWLVCFGPEVERYLGTRSFFFFYLFCGAAGVLANFLPFAINGFNPLVVGASGAVLGVLIVFALIDPEGELQFMFLPFRINRRALILGVIVLNLLQGVGATGTGGISIITHFGGMAAGYLYFKARPRMMAWGSGPSGSPWRARKPSRKSPRSPGAPRGGSDPLDDLGREVDNIFRFRGRKRGE